MDSDRDMFNTQPINNKVKKSSVQSFHYGFLILFNWDEGVKKPFKLFGRDEFGRDEISDETYIRNLKDGYRVKRLRCLKAHKGHLSIFAKVEHCKYIIIRLPLSIVGK